MRLVVLVALWMGCTSESTDDSDVGTGADSDSSVGTETDTDVTSSDADAVRGLMDGDSELRWVLAQVSNSEGWPVATAEGTFIFVAEDPGYPVFLAGDHNDWESTAMVEADGFYYVEVAMESPRGSLYKLTNGESVFVGDPWSRSYRFDEFGEISYVQAPDAGTHYARFHGVTDGTLAPRQVRIRVPNGVGPWPVLYIQDGQNLFESGGTFGSWHLEDVESSDGILLVGIDSTNDRFDEYTHAADDIGRASSDPKADAYSELVLDHVRPRVETLWGSTGTDGVLGSSLGGLVSLYIAQRDPAAWDFAGSLSGTLGWGRFTGEGPVMEELYTGRSDLGGLTVYVDSGGAQGGEGCVDLNGDGFFEDDPDDTDNYCVNRTFSDTLGSAGFVWDDTLFHWHEPGAAHSEAAWAARVFRPLGHFLAIDAE
jgi:hypothetical protein